MRNRRVLFVVLVVLAVLVSGILTFWLVPRFRRHAVATIQFLKGKRTVAERVQQYGPAARRRLLPEFERIGVPYPPDRVALVGLKAERILEVWVGADGDGWKRLKTYPILGMSGTSGPKLREGDNQVPEGIYRVESLNPNSLYHLALRVNYPNEQDRERGAEDGRTDLGSDIMIHGMKCSIGCLAMGNAASEDLFVLAAETGAGNVSILLSPVDFRVAGLPADMPPTPAWTQDLYASIRQELAKFDAGNDSIETAAKSPPSRNVPAHRPPLIMPVTRRFPRRGKNIRAFPRRLHSRIMLRSSKSE
jgi:hypothetical protein